MKLKIKNFLNEKRFLLLVIVTVPVLASCAGHSGAISAERFEMGKSRIMAQWDIDQDGVITCADAVLKRNQQFLTADLNDDGILEVDEFKQASWSNPAFAQEHLYLFDINNNGKVTEQEFISRPNAKFTAMDRNKDCKISDSEITSMLSKGKGKRLKRDGKRGKKGKGNRRNRPTVTDI